MRRRPSRARGSRGLKVVLDSETLTFKVRAQDDFGVKRVGLEWAGVVEPTVPRPAKGERILAGGGHDKENLEITGTFSAKSLDIEPQVIRAKVFAEDYLPGRPRVYSPTYVLYVLNPQQHAIWLTEQLAKWQRQSLDVRDRELQLFETNKQLRAMSPQELDRPETRRRIESQAGAEWANGRRLSHLVSTGEDLVRQAARNPEFGVGHLEKWAEMLQILKDIAGNRMPTVADLLKQASQAAATPSGSNNKTAHDGANPRDRAGPAGEQVAVQAETVGHPEDRRSGIDAELSARQETDFPSSESKSQSKPRLGLVTTTVMGKGSPGAKSPAAQKMDEAVQKQQDLLAEFEKVADELKRDAG